MGWQPMVAVYVVQRWVDPTALRDGKQAAPHYLLVASLAPLGLVGIAMGVAYLAGAGHGLESSPPGGMLIPSVEGLVVLLAGMCGTLLLIWVQALAEEIGWRGYFLPRMMREFGVLRGLAAHGFIWGLWYAPLFLIAMPHSLGIERAIAFVVTCMLLGGLLGWLRLASRSIVPTTLANGMLTVAAGLPLLLRGDDPGVRAAVYAPAGWVPLGLALVFILTTRHRHALRVPALAIQRPAFRIRADLDRTLH
jgi:uncharacterized protein